jgi:hypothetical protein
MVRLRKSGLGMGMADTTGNCIHRGRTGIVDLLVASSLQVLPHSLTNSANSGACRAEAPQPLAAEFSVIIKQHSTLRM